MNGYLRQSTASQSRTIGPFVDDTDFKTAKTALTIANTDIKLRANGTTLSNKNSGGGTHETNGVYSVTWDATDTANVGELFFSVLVSGALQVFGTYVVLEEAVYDEMFAASALGYVDGATVNATKIGGTTQTGRDLGASVLLSSGTGTGQVLLSSGTVTTGAISANAITATAIASDAITAGKIAADAIGASELGADAVTEIVNGILNEVNTGATHNVNNSVGKQIRQASGGTVVTIRSGTAQSGSTANTIKLDAGASATNNIYNGDLVVITGGTGVGQTRSIIAYNGTTKVATVDSNWVTTPDNTSTFDIIAGANSAILNEGVLQSATGTTAVLATTASSNDDVYNTAFIAIVSGTGSGQTREITDYTGSTRTVDVAAWSVTPDNTSGYVIVPNGSLSTPGGPTAAQIASAVFLTGVSTVGSINAGGITASSFGTEAIDANALADDASAEIASRVWEELLAGHTTDGSAGKTLADVVASSAPSASDVAFAVWEESLASHGTAGSAGKTLSNLGTGSATPEEIADAVLNRDFSAITDSNARTLLNAARLSRNKWTIVGTTLTVYKEDDATVAWTAELVQNTTGRPVSSVDPA